MACPSLHLAGFRQTNVSWPYYRSMSHSSGHGRDPDPASVLEVIRGTTRSWEQDPRPYATADEEQLRSILVGSLNGAFLGRATAESFNGRGKVDITVRSGSDNVLLAECKSRPSKPPSGAAA